MLKPVTTESKRSSSAMTTVSQAYRFAIDPTPEQANFLRSHMGGTRFAYNALLGLVKANRDENRAREVAGEEVAKGDYLRTCHLDLQKLWYERRDELAPWWNENGASTYNYACLNLSKAFTNFHAGRSEYPTFKRRGGTTSVSFMTHLVRLTDSHHVRLSRIGEVKTYESTRKLFRHLERGTGRIMAATVSTSGTRHFISFTVEVQRAIPATRTRDRVIGIDVGLSTLYTGATPEGEQVLHVENPRNFVTTERQLAHTQRIASRRQGPRKGVTPSNRWKKANRRVQKVHAHVANSRKNLIHGTTSMLAKNYDVIVVEDLNIAGMLKNRALAKHISDASWGEFTRQLEYKTKWYGSTLVKVDRFYPSSKTCASCGTVKAKLPLATRTYACDLCGHKVDRDLNAAINLARQGLAGTSSVTGREGEVSPKHQQLDDKAQPYETSTKTRTKVRV